MPKMTLTNKARGPRFFHLEDGSQRVLAVGETADLDLKHGPDKDRVLAAMIEAGEIEDAGSKKARASLPAGFDPAQYAKDQEELAKLRARVAEHDEARQAAELDTARKTPPRQFAGDGGPGQEPTVDGQGGALTPSQEEHGRREPPAEAGHTVPVVQTPQRVRDAQEAEKKAAERDATAAAVVEHVKAHADKPAAKK